MNKIDKIIKELPLDKQKTMMIEWEKMSKFFDENKEFLDKISFKLVHTLSLDPRLGTINFDRKQIIVPITGIRAIIGTAVYEWLKRN